MSTDHGNGDGSDFMLAGRGYGGGHDAKSDRVSLVEMIKDQVPAPSVDSLFHFADTVHSDVFLSDVKAGNMWHVQSYSLPA